MRLFLLALLWPATLWAGPKIVTDIPPVGALVAQVMDGIGTPEVLLTGSADPHSFQLRPSQAAALAQADALIWIGPRLTPWLGRIIAATGSARSVVLTDAPGIIDRPPMFGGVSDDAESPAVAADLAQHDPHIWLDPQNGKAMVDRIAVELADLDPANATRYRSNADIAKAGLDRLEANIAAELAPWQQARLVAYHDAFAAFAARFGLDFIASAELGDASAPSAATLRDLRTLVTRDGADCAFTEPQHNPALIDSLAADTGLEVGEIDPEGTSQPPGPGAYAATLQAAADGIVACLTR